MPVLRYKLIWQMSVLMERAECQFFGSKFRKFRIISIKITKFLKLRYNPPRKVYCARKRTHNGCLVQIENFVTCILLLVMLNSYAGDRFLNLKHTSIKWAAPSEFGTYRLCEQRRFRRACASAQSRQNLRCSLIQAVSQEEPSDRKPDLWPL